MKRSMFLTGMSLIVAVALMATFALPAFAHGPNNAQEGGSDKILVANVPIGSVIATFHGLSMPGPTGSPAASIAAPAGGTIETFAPVGKTTSVYLWDAMHGYRLLGVVSPSAGFAADTVLDAAGK